MKRITKTLFLSFLMIVLGLSAATNSMNESIEITTLEEPSSPQEVILPANLLNEAGHQEGSIFTDTTLSSGSDHTCAILHNGSVSCWGDGGSGRLGNGSTSQQNSPTLISSLGTGRTAVAISSGSEHTCAILDNGDVSCWGDGGYGQLGNGGTSSKTTPTLTSSLGANRTAIAISSGSRHTCAILDNGDVSCWGYGVRGALGNGQQGQKLTPTLTSSLGANSTAIAISSGSEHTCAILDNGSVSCWGRGDDGQLGNGGTTLLVHSPTLTNSLGANRTAVAISSGFQHTCAILDNGDVSCWGYGGYGQLGGGTNAQQNSPTLTSSLGTNRTAVAISSGSRHTCAILDNGSVSCWGSSQRGQLGNGGTIPYSYPTLTSSLGTGRTAVALSSGYRSHNAFGGYFTCAILDTGVVTCWGDGTSGQLGNGGTSDRTTPTATNNLGPSNYWETAALSERDFDNNGILNIFESPPPSLVTCSAGQYGRYLCVDAPSGKYVPTAGAIYATEASPGHYVDLSLGTGQTSQTACLAGTYNPNSGSTTSTDCLDASIGHYVDSSLGTGQTSQTACLAGTYNPNSSSTTSTDCLDASGGHYVYTTGQSTQLACSKGTYQPLTAQSTCNVADIGSYVSAVGQLTQTACPTGQSTITTGSNSPTQCISDFDNDSIVDILDPDDDDDGVSDLTDQCLTTDFNLTSDYDNDGCDDSDEDTDDDNDGVLDFNDHFPLDATESIDTDNDGTGNNADMDDDGDNVTDLDDDFPLDSTESVDTDDDGTGDNADTDDDNDGVLDVNDAFPLDSTESVDTDEDGTGDNADTDDDNDGVLDVSDPFPLDSTESVDTDEDGTGDNTDTDDDNDGMLDVNDPFPLDSNEWLDSDNDGIGNFADTDDDNDGVLDVNDAFPYDSSEWADIDNDGTGDNADTDNDNDGVLDVNDAFPLNSTESADTDEDGTGDNADTDDDGDNVPDVDDAFPLDPSESEDTDNDGTGDNADLDDDGDSVLDADDAFPLDPSESKDTDNDGIGDNADTNDDSLPVDSTSKDIVADEGSSIPGFTGILATLSLLGAAFIRRNK